jgi:hypothetical protein
MTAMKQITITVPTNTDNREVFEQVLSAINSGETEGQIGDEGTWSGIILEGECECIACDRNCDKCVDTIVDIVGGVIDGTCIECSQFYVDIGESACICDLLMDSTDLDINGYDGDEDDGSNDFCEEWERQQREILKDISPEDRKRIADDLPNIPYGDEDGEE